MPRLISTLLQSVRRAQLAGWRGLSTAVAACGLIAASADGPPHWQMRQVERLVAWLDAAPGEGLGPVAADADKVRLAVASGDEARLDRVATAAAVRLIDAHRIGCCNAALRNGWNMPAESAAPEPLAAVTRAVALNDIDGLFGAARPSHPFYEGLRDAYKREQDPNMRAKLAANMDRWRWMPRSMGRRYLLVNAAALEASLWEGRHLVGRWRVIVGKTGSPTPVFAAQVTGVTFNPWWEIPSSIVEESVGALMRNKPAEAARKGYVVENGRYRQRPGPANALGRMKLVMPNPFSVYLHDTPGQKLFERDLRALSHGCVRVEGALDLAVALLGNGWDRAAVDTLVSSGRTKTVPLAEPLFVYVSYFTAEPDGKGGVRFFPDIYGRDRADSGAASVAECR